MAEHTGFLTQVQRCLPQADPLAAADTIRVLVSTDNHVGYAERDAERGDDSWKTFHEIMCLAKERDVDMVLLAGDLFHDNKPSRKAMYQVMRSLRMNCYGDKPCELEMLSDGTEIFDGAFNHVNYEDPDINVAIPVFSIHGNHDDPSGEGNFAALDLLQMSGLLNYYGRVPQSDNISVKPVLLQKGNTKLALYGLSNVRDERLFRTFRDGQVKFFQPNTQKDDWFNIMSVHQNHVAHTDTSYLPESFLPSFIDLVIWGHEHPCEIEPRHNREKGFRVMQPGSSVATSLIPGEAQTKKVAILSIKGKDFGIETIRLKTVRPFIYRDIALMDDKRMCELSMQSGDIKPKVARYLMDIVEDMIEEAHESWKEANQESDDFDGGSEVPKPLIRLRVDYSAPEGGNFEVDNPQRFSSRFQGKVANLTDVVQFHRKRSTIKTGKSKAENPEEERLAQMEMDSIKVAALVEEFLAAQSLTILPQNTFSDAVGQFVDKDDKHAMADFVKTALEDQVSHLVGGDEEDEVDEDRVAEMMEAFREKAEISFSKGERSRRKKRKTSRKPKPDYWDSDADGPWEDNPLSIMRDDDGNAIDEDEGEVPPPRTKSTRGSRGSIKAAGGTTRATAAAKKAPAKSAGGRGKKKQPFEEDEDEDEDGDLFMTNGHDPIEIDDDEEEEDDVFVKPAPSKRTAPAKKTATKAATSKAANSKANGKQSSLGSFFAGSQGLQGDSNGSRATASGHGKAPSRRVQEPVEDEIDDDSDEAFEAPPPPTRTRLRR
jgi:double-strand break repair protein MRE11